MDDKSIIVLITIPLSVSTGMGPSYFVFKTPLSVARLEQT